MSQAELGIPTGSRPLRQPGISAESLYEKCMTLARNLWWSWHPEVVNLFRDLDPIRWRQLDHNPISLLAEFTPQRLETRATEMVLHSRVNHAYRQLREYLKSGQTWGATQAGVLGARPVAYFSAEFGIHESVPIYSGGLGVLSGDHIKSASGLGIPLVAIGLFYDQGYFRQQLDLDGYQHEEYVDSHVDNLPLEPALCPQGNPITVEIETREGRLLAKVWKVLVGRVSLFLLDCDVDGNKPEDRQLTSRLYGGDTRTRIRQELVIGIGGTRALRAMGIRPAVYHLNEGHSAFAVLEVIQERMHQDGLAFDDALREVSQQTVFTTHTPVPAGHDRFDADLIEEHIGPLRDKLGISSEQLMGLGRVEPQNEREPFCMTVLALKVSRRANAVSSLHGHVSRRMWSSLWPWRVEEEIPIGHITNGVHIPSWLAWQMKQLYDRNFPAAWTRKMGEPEVWQHIHRVDPGELWETHNALKNQLLAFTRRRLSRQCRRRGESDEMVEAARTMLDPSVLTIGIARRFATYKRADLVFTDIDRAAALVQDSDRPIQFIVSGKAHPADEPGKALIQKIANLRLDERFAGRVVFLEDYDINVARHLVQGIDVWLNNPRRPLEASGTSGQKVVLNGGLNFSVLDGWWAEAYNGSNGFAIGQGRSHVSDETTDARDAADLYRVLEDELIPMYYDRDDDGLPREWIGRMMNSIGSLAWRFSSHRMVMDYCRSAYIPAAGGLSCDMKM
ncbi:MAG: alpha-glucan family phosphorylase [Planctomycetota bacterium]|nr:MAG: alpha-glucan family phosphorylase [Planctomycetota bacterium]REJ96846.1 MAG: alpha-glucan family phosphorylase [Planctomycetota bacterium]REK24035.1 MAG: alpha-glucan family phosphorylase [Planctomycetota bacterium]REK39366.1 MAG: alpha-glucan family phosphorylase [Planctomycetota bacterium]